MSYHFCMQFTVRNITADIDAAARERAAAEQKSLNAVLVDALRRGLGVGASPTKKRDLSFLAQGPPLEPEVLQALEDQRQIDPEMWK